MLILAARWLGLNGRHPVKAVLASDRCAWRTARDVSGADMVRIGDAGLNSSFAENFQRGIKREDSG